MKNTLKYLILTMAFLAPAVLYAAQEKPNILVIFTDDIGISRENGNSCALVVGIDESKNSPTSKLILKPIRFIFLQLYRIMMGSQVLD